MGMYLGENVDCSLENVFFSGECVYNECIGHTPLFMG